MSEVIKPVISAMKPGPTRQQIGASPMQGKSPSSRQAAKEEAEAAALAEIETELKARRARSAELRKLRLKQEERA